MASPRKDFTAPSPRSNAGYVHGFDRTASNKAGLSLSACHMDVPIKLGKTSATLIDRLGGARLLHRLGRIEMPGAHG